MRIVAILPLPSLPQLSSTPRPDLALFSADFLTQTFESDLESKPNKKPNTLPNYFFFLVKKGDTLFHTYGYSNLKPTAHFELHEFCKMNKNLKTQPIFYSFWYQRKACYRTDIPGALYRRERC